MTNVEFEQLLSTRLEVEISPNVMSAVEQPTIKDFIFDFYCGRLKDTDKANLATKAFTDKLFKKFVNRKM